MRRRLSYALITFTAAAVTYCGDGEAHTDRLPQFSGHDPTCEDAGCEDINVDTSTQTLEGQVMLRLEVRIPAVTSDNPDKTLVLLTPVEDVTPLLVEEGSWEER